MNKKNITISICIFILSYFSILINLYAAPNETHANLVENTISGKSVADSEESSFVILKLLRQEITLQKEHNSQLMSVLLWSLGFCAIFLVSLTALIGFVTDKRHKQDKESIEANLKAELVSWKADFETINLAWKLEATNQFKDKYIEIASSLEKIADEAASKSTTKINAEVIRHKRKLKDFEKSAIELEAKIYSVDKNYALVVTQYLKLAELALLDDSDWELTRALESLKEGLKNGGFFSTQEKVRAADFLEKLPTKFKHLGSAIQIELEKS